MKLYITNEDESLCIVFVTNKKYFDKFVKTCTQLLTVGAYNGPICLVIGDDIYDDTTSDLLKHPIIVENNIIIKHFPDIRFDEDFLTYVKSLKRDPHWFPKIFQYHKLHLFNAYFKQWSYIFYLDAGITIMSDIRPLLYNRKKHSLLAHSDAYPTHERKLTCQFDKSKKLFENLNQAHNLNIDYFQTTIMLYDTQIIESDTYDNLLDLTYKYPNSITNDQGIIALYFTNIKPLFEQIAIKEGNLYFYDYLSRDPTYKYIMLKTV
jgi:hypothetical protein